jgi:hypothetical protein
MKNKLTILLAVQLIILVLLGCGKKKRCNPLDPGGESYQNPSAIITFPSGGYIAPNNKITIKWTGNNSHCLYSYKLSYSSIFNQNLQAGWSGWVNAQQITIGNLDEEVYTFGVKARYPMGEEQYSPSTVSYSVNAVANSSLLIKPCSTLVYLNNDFTIGVMVKEVSDLMAAKITLNFSDEFLEFQNCFLDTEFLSDTLGLVFPTPTVQDHSGRIEMNLGIAAGVSGSGTLIKITFKAKKKGVASISFESCDLRDTNNQSIQINGTRNGKVSIN